MKPQTADNIVESKKKVSIVVTMKNLKTWIWYKVLVYFPVFIKPLSEKYLITGALYYSRQNKYLV